MRPSQPHPVDAVVSSFAWVAIHARVWIVLC
jgi:hypothetical protein